MKRNLSLAALALTTMLASPALAASGKSPDGKASWTTDLPSLTSDLAARITALSSSYYVASAQGGSLNKETTYVGDHAILSTGGSNQASGYVRAIDHSADYTPTGATVYGSTFYDTQNVGGYGAGTTTLTFKDPQAYFGALINSNAETRSLVFQYKSVTVLTITLNPAAMGTAVTNVNGRANYAFYVNAMFAGTLFDSVALNTLTLSPGGTSSTVSMTNVTTDTVIPSDRPGGTVTLAGGTDVDEPGLLGTGMVGAALVGMIGLRRRRA